MKYAIDFSLFESPTRAYGNVTGELNLEFVPYFGATVTLLRGTLPLRVQLINTVDGRDIILFDDVMADSPEHAALLAERLEQEEGLFCPPYHEP